MIILALLAAAGEPAEGPAVFVKRLYANYRNSDYNPLIHPEQVSRRGFFRQFGKMSDWRAVKSASWTVILSAIARTRVEYASMSAPFRLAEVGRPAVFRSTSAGRIAVRFA